MAGESLGDVVVQLRADGGKLKSDIASEAKGAFAPLESEASTAGSKASKSAGKKFSGFKTLVAEFAKGASGELADQLEQGGSEGATGAGKKMGLLKSFVANAAHGAADELETQLADAGKDGGKKAGQEADEELTKAGKDSGKHFGGGFSATLKGILTGGAILGLINKVGGAISSQLSEAITQSDATDKFKQTLAFAGQSKKQIAQLTKSAQDYADQTVYDLADSQNAIAQLTANGIKNSDKLVKSLGNLNAVAGGNADTFKSVGLVLTQTAGAGKLTTENWNQLAEAIPGASGILQKQLKKNGAYVGNFRDAMAKGEISAEEFNKAISDTGGSKAAQEAATSTKTIEGAWGNLQASVVGGLAKMVSAVKPFVTGGMTLLANAFDKVFDSAGAFAKKLEPAENAVKLFFGTLSGKGSDAPVPDAWMNPIIDAAGQIAAVFDSIKKIGGEALSGFMDGLKGIDLSSVTGIVQAFSPLGGIIQGLLPALSQMGELWKSLGGILGTLIAQLVPVLLPALISLAKVVIGTLATAFTTLLPVLVQLATTFVNIAGQILPAVVTVISALIPPIMQLVSSLLPVIVKLFAALAPALVPVAQLLGTLVKAVLPILTGVLLPILVGLLKVLIPVLTLVVKVLASVIAFVVKVIAAIVSWVAHTKTITEIWSSVVGWFKAKLIPFLSKTLPAAFAAVVNWVKKHWPAILTILTGPIGLAVSQIIKHRDKIESVLKAVWHWVQNTFSKLWHGVTKVFTHPVDSAKAAISKTLGAAGLRDTFNKFRSWTGDTWRKGWNKAEGWLKHPIQNGKSAISKILGSKGVRAVLNGLDSFGRHVFGKHWDGMKGVIQKPISAAKDYLHKVFGPGGGGVRQIFNDFVSAASKIFGKIKGAIGKPIKWVLDNVVNKALFGGINRVLGFVGMDKQKLKPIDTSGFASGGIFEPNRYTPGRDIGYAALSGYESIMRPEFTRAVGPAWVHAANRAARTGGVEGARAFLGGYASGGVAGARRRPNSDYPTDPRLDRLLGGFALGGIVRPINAAITQGIHDQYTGFPAVDAAASVGHPVVAGAAGKVTRSYDIRGYESRNAVQNGYRSYGRVIEMQNNGFKTLYAHLSERQARVGAMLKAGQQLGLSGNTGHSTGPHLHFGAQGKSPTDFWQGTFGKIIGALGGALGGLTDLIDPGKVISGAVEKALGGLRAFGQSPFVTMLGKIPPTLATDAVSYAKDKILGGMGGSNPGGSGVERWRSTVKTALAMNKVPTTDAYVNAWLRQINTESGGNPNAIQGIQDVNSASGNLARGLVQVIPPTFAAYSFPGHKNWANGLDSLLAGINYWKHAYGGNIGVIGQGHGYDDGGFLPPGLSLNYNGLSRREPKAVFTPDQWDTLRKIANSEGGSGVPDKLVIQLDDETYLTGKIVSVVSKAARRGRDKVN